MKHTTNTKIILLACFLISALSLSGYAQKDSADVKKSKLDIVPLPVLYFSPETNFGFGALVSLSFRLGSDAENTRKSNVQSYILYTLLGQVDATARYTLFTNQEKYIVNGRFSYLFFPEFFYGVGNKLPESNEELVSYRRVRVENRLLRKVSKKLFAGLQYRYVEMFQVKPKEGGLLATGQIPGSQGSRVSGLGAAVVFDSRDNILNSYKGAYLELSNYNYFSGLGSEFDYSNITIDLRKYFKLFDNRDHILAIQGFGNFTTGTAPYKELSELGGSTIMRGYYQGRYRENDYIAAQIEYRMPVWKRFGLVAFTGIGDVANEIGAFSFKDLKPSYGIGLRFKIDRANNTNIRVDYGLGIDGSSGFYLEIGEAF